MPVVLAQLLFYTACMLAGACMLTWRIQARRHLREREQAEQEMVQALEGRYQVYQDLEQSMKRVLSRLDAMEGSPRTDVRELAPAANRRPGVRRGADAGAWDAERSYEVQRAQLAEEVSAQASRIAQLMDEAEGLERVESKLVAAEERCCELSASLEAERIARQELEEARAAHASKLNQRVHELEAENERLCETREALDEMRVRTAESDRRRKAEIDQLQQRVSALEAVEAELADAREGLHVRERVAEELRARVAHLEQRAEELEDEHIQALASVREALEAAESKNLELGLEVQSLEKAAAGLREDVAAREHVGAALREDMAAREQVLAGMREDVAALQRVVSELNQDVAAREIELNELRQSRNALEKGLSERESAMAERDVELRAREADLQRSLEELASAREELRQRDVTLKQREAEVQRLTEAWEGAEARVADHRTRLAKQTQHVEAAQSVLAELRPMIEALESRLQPDAALESVAAPLPTRKQRNPAPKPEAKPEVSSIERDLGMLDLGD